MQNSNINSVTVSWRLESTRITSKGLSTDFCNFSSYRQSFSFYFYSNWIHIRATKDTVPASLNFPVSELYNIWCRNRWRSLARLADTPYRNLSKDRLNWIQCPRENIIRFPFITKVLIRIKSKFYILLLTA